MQISALESDIKQMNESIVEWEDEIATSWTSKPTAEAAAEAKVKAREGVKRTLEHQQKLGEIEKQVKTLYFYPN